MRKTLLTLTIFALAALPLGAATRLTFALDGNYVPVEWAATSFPITYQVDARLANAFPTATATVDRAFTAWSSVPETNLSFRSLGVADNARAGYNQQNSVSLADDLFSGQGFIALTTNWYDANGKIIESDIQVDSTLIRSDYNIQLALEHEVGHLLGLDHSAVISAVMYPYVSKGTATPQLDSDDRIAIVSSYPKSDPTMLGGTLEGKVMGNEGGIYAAQVVAVNERGEPVATALSDSTGTFVLSGLPAGNYRVYAEPLDGPVDTRNLAGIWRNAKVQSFPTEFLAGGTVRVDNGSKVGNLTISSSGPMQLNPRWIGVASPDSVEFDLRSTPSTLRAGQTVNVAVGGEGMVSGMTTFDIINTGFQRVGDFRYAGNYVYATFNVRGDAPAGSAVVVVKNSSRETAMLTGALRVEAAGGGGRTRVARK